MNYKRCIYYVEGSCEQQLVNALKMEPRKLVPGKVIVHNVIQDEISRREIVKILGKILLQLKAGPDLRCTGCCRLYVIQGRASFQRGLRSSKGSVMEVKSKERVLER